MPNHVHGIIQLLGDEYTSRDVACNVSTSEHMSNISPKSGTLSTIVRSYKSAVTRSIRKHHHPKFEWQPRFYDHVIRNDQSLNKIRQYINLNPKNWKRDRNYYFEKYSSFITLNFLKQFS